MKTKTSTTPLDTERVRDNQRRSRQRKKEYIHILEARLAEYEKNGVQASVVLQKKARAVAEENVKLKVLLNEFGMSDESIRATLCSEPSFQSAQCSSSSSCCSQTASPREETSSLTSNFEETSLASPPASAIPTIPPTYGQFSEAILAQDEGSSLSITPVNFSCCDLNSLIDSDIVPDQPVLRCDSLCFPTPISGMSPSSSYTPCKTAFAFLKALNRRRSVKMNLYELALYYMWSGFRASSDDASDCMVDDDVLFSVANELVRL